MNPRVLVGCPTSFHKEYCIELYADSIKNLTYNNYDILLVDNSPDEKYLNKIKSLGINAIKGLYYESARDRIVASRNLLKEYVLKNNYDYLLSLEQDVIPPPDIIERMLSHNKKVISGVYFARNVFENEKILIPLAYVEMPSKNDLPSMRPLNEFELFYGPNLIKIISCGLGCVMIHKSILNNIQFRYDLNTFDDRWFCIDLLNKKIPLYCDTSIKCRHMILNRPYQWAEIKK
ncbi:glycosyltransferase family 2 protein [Candidatus Woesearchaeota archaeon]|nr:glycosyltransferase family 2 protein [Candidatus Woesearchaeota archaeon]